MLILDAMSENKIQAALIKEYRNRYGLRHHSPRLLMFHVPNGGARNKAEGVQLKAMGVMSGVSDLCLIRDGRTLWLELKAEGGMISDEQKEFLETAASGSISTACAWGIDQAREVIDRWLAGEDMRFYF